MILQLPDFLSLETTCNSFFLRILGSICHFYGICHKREATFGKHSAYIVQCCFHQKMKKSELCNEHHVIFRTSLDFFHERFFVMRVFFKFIGAIVFIGGWKELKEI